MKVSICVLKTNGFVSNRKQLFRAKRLLLHIITHVHTKIIGHRPSFNDSKMFAIKTMIFTHVMR
jgi:hypothetical protein